MSAASKKLLKPSMFSYRNLICMNRTIIIAKSAFSEHSVQSLTSLRNGRFLRTTSTISTESKKDLEDDINKPIQFSTSPAAKWKAKVSRSGEKEPRLWYEPYVVAVSLTVFLLYFLVLREESDVDEEFGKSLYSRIEGLEEQQLRLALEYNKEHGLSKTEIEERLKEIKEENTQNTM